MLWPCSRRSLTLRAALVKEMRGRIKEDDSEFPEKRPWLY